MYNSLSNHLNKTFNECIVDTKQINEGLADGLKSLFGFKPSNKQTKAATGFLGIIGTLWSKVSENESEIAKTFREQEEKARDNAKKRAEDLKNSAEGALVAKIKAKFAQKENQMDLENKRKCEAYDARKKQFEDDAKFWEKNSTIFTEEQCEALNKQREEAYQQLGTLDTGPLVRMNQLAAIISCDEQGNPLTKEQILDKANKDADFKKYFEEFNSLAKKYKKEITSSMSDSDFQEVLGKWKKDTTALPKAEEAISKAEKEIEEFNEIAEQVDKYNKAEKKHNEIQEKFDAHNKKIEDFRTGKIGDVDIYTVNNSGVIDITANNETLKNSFISLAKSLGNDDEIKTDGNIDLDKYKAKLASYGVPKSVIDKITKANIDSIFNPDDDTIKNALNDVEDDEWDDVKEKMKSKLQSQYNELQASQSEINAELKQNPKPDINKDEYNKIKNLSKEERVLYDVTTDAGKAEKDKIDEELKNAKKALKKLEDSKVAAANSRAEMIKEITAADANKVPDELKEKVAKKVKGVGFGEERRGDKVGVSYGPNTNDFLEKPGPNASDEDKEKYEKILAKKLVSASLKNIAPEKVIKDGDKYYKVNEDGSKGKELSEEEAINIYANNIIKSNQQGELLKYKQDLAKTITSCIKDGKLDEEKYLKLTPAQKEAIKTILKDNDGIDKYFEGVDLAGATTLNSIKKAIKDNKSEIVTDMDDYDTDHDDAYSKRTNTDNDEWEDVEDDDEDAKDEKDYESDEDEEYTDETTGETKTRKKSISNPAKEWKRKKKKNGKGKTKSYYNTKGESISADEYKEKMDRYKKAKAKANKSQTQQENKSLSNSLANLLESKHTKTKTINYTELRDRLLNSFN